MRRREFITLLGGAISARPFAVHARGLKAIPKVGLLFPGPEDVAKSRRVLLLDGLRSEGFREPDQITLVTRATNDDLTRISPLLNELIAEKIDVLIPLGPAVTRAALSLTTSVPIVIFDLETDPIESGWLRSYAHPGGNITGIFSDFSAKWLELLKEAVPKCAHIVVLWDPTTTTVQTKAIAVAAQQVHVSSEVLEIKGTTELDAVFETVNERHQDGLVILSSPVVSINSKRFAELALKYRMPAFPCFQTLLEPGG
jgi:putative ABC transport system substrate-binding protein